MGKFNELKPIGARWIDVGNRRLRCRMWKRTHDFPLMSDASRDIIADELRMLRIFQHNCIEIRGYLGDIAISMQFLRMMDMDQTDSDLLRELQRDAQQTAADLSDRLNLSASQIGRRRQRLEESGIITGVSARLDPARLGLSVQAFIQVSMVAHSPDNARSFQSLIRTRREVISAWTLTGEADYLLRVYCRDLPALNMLVHEVFLPHKTVARVQSQIVMDQTKPDSPLPV